MRSPRSSPEGLSDQLVIDVPAKGPGRLFRISGPSQPTLIKPGSSALTFKRYTKAISGVVWCLQMSTIARKVPLIEVAFILSATWVGVIDPYWRV